jgi:cytochrome c
MMSPVRAAAIFSALALGTFAVADRAVAQAAPVSGETLFKQRCAMCHGVDAAAKPGVGPNLKGIVNRKAAQGAFKFSPALAKSKLVWNQANLDAYLKAPTKMVPGTRMVIAVSDAAQRKALIAYLAKAK